MTILETLYKRTKTGAIQYWKIFINPQQTSTVIGKESGQLGTTSPVVHFETIHCGKNIGKSNETTPLEQANLQAQSDILRKKDEGYKSLTDLGVLHPGTDHIYEILNTGYGTLNAALESVLPRYNSDASGQPKPMLAKAVNWKKVTYPCYVQPKLDGVRCLLVASAESIKFLSRSGKEYTTLNHIAKDMQMYLDHVEEFIANDQFILDGEIYSDQLSFQEIVAAVKKQSPDSLKLQFRAYDMVENFFQDKRLETLAILLQDIGSNLINLVDTHMVSDQGMVKSLHDQFVQQGYEGAMIRNPTGIYGQGQRSSDLLKVKEFDETEFEFRRFEKGQRDEDLIAVCLTAKMKEFRAKMIGTKEMKKILEAALTGTDSLLTVKHFGWTTDGLPRFPVGKAFRNY